jgi:hypothetical protein
VSPSASTAKHCSHRITSSLGRCWRSDRGASMRPSAHLELPGAFDFKEVAPVRLDGTEVRATSFRTISHCARSVGAKR